MTEKANGFTILELLVALAIIGVSAAIAVPSMFEYMSRNRLKGAARQIMSDLMWARMQAVTQKNEFRVFFVNDHQYEILDDDDNDGKVDKTERVRKKDIRSPYFDVRIGSTGNPTFFPRGNASIGTVTLSNGSGAKKVKVHLTGRIKIT